MSTQTIGHISKASGTPIETIRFYEREGLIPEAPRTAAGYRLYNEDTTRRLRFITRAKALGFTLAEIREILNLQDNPASNRTGRAEVKAITEKKLADIERRIDDLRRMQKVLNKLAGECSGRGGVTHCPIIESLSGVDDYTHAEHGHG